MADHWLIEASLESMKQNKYNDLEVSDLSKENAKVDELARHVYYTTKAIRRLTLSEAKVVSTMAPRLVAL